MLCTFNATSNEGRNNKDKSIPLFDKVYYGEIRYINLIQKWTFIGNSKYQHSRYYNLSTQKHSRIFQVSR